MTDHTSNKNRVYRNETISVYWTPSECRHATVCFTRLRTVFDPARRPWVNMKGGDTEQILEIVRRCPTMALTFRWNDPVLDAEEKSPKHFTGKEENYLDKAEK